MENTLQTVVRILMLDYKTCPFYLAQCLHTVTEDNISAAQLLCGSSDLMKTLEKSLMADGTTSDMLLLKVLTAGITCVS